MSRFLGSIAENNKDRLKYINFSGSYGFALILKKKIIYLLMVDTHLQAKNSKWIFFEILNIPKEIPNIVFEDRKLKIGFNPKFFAVKL